MILYLDSSALVKRYVAEVGSDQVNQVLAAAEMTGTAEITRVEVAAALARAVRVGALSPKRATAALQEFRDHWFDSLHVQISEMLVARADALAWEHGLRGYDAVHLAAALTWQEALELPVVLATFDLPLWETAGRVGLVAFPEDLRALMSRPRRRRA